MGKRVTELESSVRMTKTRRFVLEALGTADRPQSVPELQAILAKKKYYPHKTTLYREIEQLVLKGVLTKVQLSEARVSYELSGDHHHHFVCQVCFRVTKLSFCEQLMTKIGKALEGQGKHITHHNFEFFGVCEFCFKV